MTDKKTRPALTEKELAAVILGLAEYGVSGKAEEDGYSSEEMDGLRTRLKRLANKSFNANWGIIEDEEDEL